MTPEPDTVPVARRGGQREVARRRRPAELRTLLLDTGARLFAAQGYEATTYQQITAGAGVSDSVLFRHFGSREQLLIEAVVEPFAEFLDDFSRRWSELNTISTDEEHPLRRVFVAELFSRLSDHREPLRAMLTALRSPAGEELMGEVGTRLDTVIGQVRDIGEQHDRARGRTTAGVELKLRLVIGMVVTAAVLDDWFIPADAQGEMTDLLTASMAELALIGRPITVLVRPEPVGELPGPAPVTVAAGPGRRRRPDAVRWSIITAARGLFADPGYGATTYRAIAEAAGTSESALFRHFGTKSALVPEAVFDPVVTAYAGCRARWTDLSGDGSTVGRSYLLVELYRYFRGVRAQLRLLMGFAHDNTHDSTHDALDRQVREWLGDVLRGLAPDPANQAHISSLMAMALAAATLDDWFLPHGPEALSGRAIETALEAIASEGRDNSG